MMTVILYLFISSHGNQQKELLINIYKYEFHCKWKKIKGNGTKAKSINIVTLKI
jgi:hypothetical protein